MTRYSCNEQELLSRTQATENAGRVGGAIDVLYVDEHGVVDARVGAGVRRRQAAAAGARRRAHLARGDLLKASSISPCIQGE